MKQGRFFINRITLAMLLTCLVGSASAVEFNTDVLDAGDKKNIDFSRFSQAGYILPGTYQMQALLNGESLGNDIAVPFFVRGSQATNAMPEACLSPSEVERLGLTEEAGKLLGSWHGGACVDFSRLNGATLRGDVSNGTLLVNIPQAWLEYSDATWLPPSRWDNGIPGVLLDYNVNGTVTKNHHGGQEQNGSINGTAGANLGAWRLRADYQGYATHTTGGTQGLQKALDISRVYLYRPLPSLRSTLMLGENYANSDLFDSWRYAGVSLASDERMLPPRLRGYAPEVIGVAQTNARVTVTQQGRVVYDSTVPAGPFRIQSLDSSVRGQLDVKVTEQNGEVRTFSVSTASVPYLTRPGQVRYKLLAGKPSDWEHHSQGPMFASGEATWGVSNSWSVYGGGTFADTYQTVALGVGRDLFALGTFSVDVTQSFADLPGERLEGKSWRIQYSKRFDDANADITFAGYRFSERNYMSMQQYLDTRYQGYRSEHEKERYQVNLSKSFDDFPASISVDYEQRTYWDRGDTKGFGGSVYTYFDLPSLGLRSASLGLTVRRSQYLGRDDDTVSLNLSVPLGSGSVSYGGSYSSGRYAQTAGYYGRVANNDSYSLNAGINHGNSQPTSSQFNAMYSHQGNVANLSANVGVQQNSYTSVGLSAAGGLTVTGEGAALHPGGYNGGTRLMVDTDGVGGVPIDGGRVVTNPWGIGVLADIGSYYRSTAQIDVNKLANDVEATKGVVEAALTEGAIGYRKFTVLKGARLFAILRLSDGSYPPFGASVLNPKGRELGIVGENGLSWLTGVEGGDALGVAWDGRTQCQTSIPMKLNDQQQMLLPCLPHSAGVAMSGPAVTF